MAQLVGASDGSSEDPHLTSGWISISFFHHRTSQEPKFGNALKLNRKADSFHIPEFSHTNYQDCHTKLVSPC